MNADAPAGRGQRDGSRELPENARPVPSLQKPPQQSDLPFDIQSIFPNLHNVTEAQVFQTFELTGKLGAMMFLLGSVMSYNSAARQAARITSGADFKIRFEEAASAASRNGMRLAGLALVPFSIMEWSKLLRGKEDIYSHTVAFGSAGLAAGLVLKPTMGAVTKLTVLGVGFGAAASVAKDFVNGNRNGEASTQSSSPSIASALWEGIRSAATQLGFDNKTEKPTKPIGDQSTSVVDKEKK